MNLYRKMSCRDVLEQLQFVFQSTLSAINAAIDFKLFLIRFIKISSHFISNHSNQISPESNINLDLAQSSSSPDIAQTLFSKSFICFCWFLELTSIHYMAWFSIFVLCHMSLYFEPLKLNLKQYPTHNICRSTMN